MPTLPLKQSYLPRSLLQQLQPKIQTRKRLIKQQAKKNKNFGKDLNYFNIVKILC
jgi:hypothetical protein